MPRTCYACHHDRRAEVEAAILEGRSLRDVARQYGLSKDGLSRHRGHISPALVRVMERREERQAERGPETALARLENLYAKAVRVLEAAETAGHTAQQLAAIREARGIVETLAKVTGELREQPAGVTVNVLQSRDILRYIAVVREELRDQPDLLTRIATRLQLGEPRNGRSEVRLLEGVAR